MSVDFFDDITNLLSFEPNVCAIAEDGTRETYGTVVAKALAMERSWNIDGNNLVFIEGSNTVRFLIAYLAALSGSHTIHIFDPSKKDNLSTLVSNYSPAIVVYTLESDTTTLKNAHNAVPHPDLCLLLPTSGSTGATKFVKVSKHNISTNTLAICEYLEMREEDSTITTLKPFYSYGLSVINSHLAVGGAIFFDNSAVTADSLWQRASLEGITNISGVPFMYEWLHRTQHPLNQFKSLRFMTQAGGKLAPNLVKYFSKIGGEKGYKFYVMYGQTEASPRISYLPPELAESNPDCIGVPIPGGKLYTLNDQGDISNDSLGIEGELIYEGPNVTCGYAYTEADLKALEHSKTLNTGDIAVQKSNGLWSLRGRKSRFIKPFGVRVGLDDLEIFLQDLGLNCALVGHLEKAIILHVPEASSTSAEYALIRLEELTGLPLATFITKDISELPLLSNGKLDRQTLDNIARKAMGDELKWWRRFQNVVIRTFQVLIGTKPARRSVLGVFREVFKNQPVTMKDSASSLGADSLKGLELSISLEELIEHLPEDWINLSITDLETYKRDD